MLSTQVAENLNHTHAMKIRTLTDWVRHTPKEPNWLCRGLATPGVVTLLSGVSKVGKSTFLVGLLDTWRHEEGSFLNLTTRKTNVVYMTEESQQEFIAKTSIAEDWDHVAVLPIRDCPRGWEPSFKEAARQARITGAQVIVVDTVSTFCGLNGKEEYEPGPVNKVLAPVRTLAHTEGIAVILIHHMGKPNSEAPGQPGQRARGSGAWTAGVGIVSELEIVGKNPLSPERLLSCTGRLGGLPMQLNYRMENGILVPSEKTQSSGAATPSTNWVEDNQDEKFLDPRSIVSGFLEDVCIREEGAETPTDILYDQFVWWCEFHGHTPMGKISFGIRLRKEGIGNRSSNGKNLRQAVRLKKDVPVFLDNLPPQSKSNKVEPSELGVEVVSETVEGLETVQLLNKIEPLEGVERVDSHREGLGSSVNEASASKLVTLPALLPLTSTSVESVTELEPKSNQGSTAVLERPSSSKVSPGRKIRIEDW
jgi:hypothetical protein